MSTLGTVILTTFRNIIGLPHTLGHFLNAHLPLLFHSRLAYAIVQGVLAPLDCEMAWLGACLAGADGWVNICIGLSQAT